MFIGQYYHSLEAQQRLSLPKAFRAAADEWIVTRGFDGGLFLFPSQDFNHQVARLAQLPFTKKTNRDLVRLLVNQAHSVQPDKSGRVLLPNHLTTLAGISKAVVIVGSYQYLEIWDRDRYHHYLETIENQMEDIAENLAIKQPTETQQLAT